MTTFLIGEKKEIINPLYRYCSKFLQPLRYKFIIIVSVTSFKIKSDEELWWADMVEVIIPIQQPLHNLRLNACFTTTWKMATYHGTKILVTSNTCLLPIHLHQQGIKPFFGVFAIYSCYRDLAGNLRGSARFPLLFMSLRSLEADI